MMDIFKFEYNQRGLLPFRCERLTKNWGTQCNFSIE